MSTFTLVLLILSVGIAIGLIGVLRFLLKANLGFIQNAAVGLIAITGTMHLVIGWQENEILLLLNGLGYFVLLVAMYFPIGFLQPYRLPTLVILILFTLVTIVAYFLMHTPAQYDLTALGTKGIEILLIVLLVVEFWQQRDTMSFQNRKAQRL